MWSLVSIVSDIYNDKDTVLSDCAVRLIIIGIHDQAQSCRERSLGRDPWFDNRLSMGMVVSQTQS
jgi:hypothetical protein